MVSFFDIPLWSFPKHQHSDSLVSRYTSTTTLLSRSRDNKYISKGFYTPIAHCLSNYMPNLNMAGDISPLTVPVSDPQDNISVALWQRYDEIKNSQSANNALIEVPTLIALLRGLRTNTRVGAPYPL